MQNRRKASATKLSNKAQVGCPVQKTWTVFQTKVGRATQARASTIIEFSTQKTRTRSERDETRESTGLKGKAGLRKHAPKKEQEKRRHKNEVNPTAGDRAQEEELE